MVLASFTPDFERFALNLACCPSDDVISIDSPSVQMNDTVELTNLLDDVQYCLCKYDGMRKCVFLLLRVVDRNVVLTVCLSIRKCGVEGDTMQSVIMNTVERKPGESIEMEILKKKMKNLVDDGAWSDA